MIRNILTQFRRSRIQWHASLEFDPAKREAELAAVLEQLGITDEAAWSKRRAAWSRDGTR